MGSSIKHLTFSVAVFTSKRPQTLSAILQNADEFVHFVSSKHRNSCLLEIWNTFENGRSCKVSAGMQYAPILVNLLYVDAQHLFQDVYFIVQSKFLGIWSIGFAKQPRTAKGCSAYHYGIYAIAVETLLCIGNAGYIAISYYRNVYAWIFFTSPISVQSASPVYICARVRPWIVNACMPQS